jgi:hypothetical protein
MGQLACDGEGPHWHANSRGVSVVLELNQWESFYVIVGSAAGALIGLQFVVVTLIAEKPSLLAPEAGAAFATPTIVHFGAALLLSVFVRVPWPTISPAAAVWGVMGLAGIAYTLIVGRHMKIQTTYTPEFEDWVFHVALPLAAYAALALSAVAATSLLREALFGVGVAALLLLFIGIHNARDAIAYHVFVSGQDTSRSR